MLDRGDVDAVADPWSARSQSRRRAGAATSSTPGFVRGAQDQRERDVRRRRQQSERHLRDDAEGAFGTDEQIDEVHVRPRQNTRPIASATSRHAVASAPGRESSAARVDDRSRPRTRRDCAARQISSTSPSASTTVSASTHSPRAAVLECRRAGRVGGDDAAGEGAGKRRRRRKRGRPLPRSPPGSPPGVTPASDRRSRPGATATMRSSSPWTESHSPIGVAPPVSDDWAPIGSTEPGRSAALATSASVRG